MCDGCQEEESVEHIILRCSSYEAKREMMRNKLREMGVQNITLKGLLSSDRVQTRILMTFLREIGVFNRI